MQALLNAQKRYSAKKYNPHKEIPESKIEALKEILRLTPSSINIQPWKFTFVQSSDIKGQLADASLHNAEKILQAPLLIVFSVADDLDSFQKVVDSSLPAPLREWYNAGRNVMPENELKSWLSKQLYIALGFGLTACAAMDLDATPMEGIESDKYVEILGMKDYRPILAMTVGYAAENDYNRLELEPKLRRSQNDVIETI